MKQQKVDPMGVQDDANSESLLSGARVKSDELDRNAIPHHFSGRLCHTYFPKFVFCHFPDTS